MVSTVDFKCAECEEEFDNEINCKIHHMHTKHEDYEITGTEHIMKIKS